MVPTNDSKSTSEFWEQRKLIRSRSLNGMQKWLLTVIADYAGTDGDCYASIATLADACSLKVRATQNLIRSIDDLLISTERPGKPTLYRPNWEAIAAIPLQSNAGVQQDTGVQSTAGEGCTVLQGRGAAECRGGVQPNAPKHKENIHSTSNRTPKRAAPAKFDAANVELPSELDAPEFKEAWWSWCAARQERRKPISERAAREQLDQLSRAGPSAAIAAIRASIANDWQGLFPERLIPKSNGDHAGLKAFLEKQ